MAAVWPKFRRKLTTRTCASRVASCPSRWLLPSRLPSSMYRTSYETSIDSSTPINSSWSGAMLSTSLYTSTITDSRGATVAACRVRVAIHSIVGWGL